MEKMQTFSVVRAWGRGGVMAGWEDEAASRSEWFISSEPGPQILWSRVPPPKEGLLPNQGQLPLSLLPGPRLSVSCPLWSELGLQARAWLLGVRRQG